MKWDHFALCVSKKWTLCTGLNTVFTIVMMMIMMMTMMVMELLFLFHNNDNYYYCRCCCCLFVCFFPAFQPSETEIFSDLK